jgi:hypothetical protein
MPWFDDIPQPKMYLIEFRQTRKGTLQVFAFGAEGALANAKDMMQLMSDEDLREMFGDGDFQFGTPAEFIEKPDPHQTLLFEERSG